MSANDAVTMCKLCFLFAFFPPFFSSLSSFTSSIDYCEWFIPIYYEDSITISSSTFRSRLRLPLLLSQLLRRTFTAYGHYK